MQKITITITITITLIPMQVWSRTRWTVGLGCEHESVEYGIAQRVTRELCFFQLVIVMDQSLIVMLSHVETVDYT